MRCSPDSPSTSTTATNSATALSLGHLVDKTVARVLNQAAPERLTLPHDEDLIARLRGLDDLPVLERIRVLEAAIDHTRQ